MNADPQLRERLQRAAMFDGFPVEDALSDVLGGVEARRRHRKAGTLALVAAIIALLGFAGWRAAVADRPINVPGTKPSASSIPLEHAIDVTPPPPGTKTHQTVADVERYVLDQITRDEDEIGGALAPARIISVEFVPARSAGDPYAAWRVEFEGTVLHCSSWCSGHPGGVLVFSDRGPGISTKGSLDQMVCIQDIPGAQYPGSTGSYPQCTDLVAGVTPSIGGTS